MYRDKHHSIVPLTDIASLHGNMEHKDDAEENAFLLKVSRSPISIPPSYFTSKEAFFITSNAVSFLQERIKTLQMKLDTKSRQCESIECDLLKSEREKKVALSENIRLTQRLKQAEADCLKLIDESKHHHYRNPITPQPECLEAFNDTNNNTENDTQGSFRCTECGNNYPTRKSLASHHKKRHNVLVASAGMPQAAAPVVVDGMNTQKSAFPLPAALVPNYAAPTQGNTEWVQLHEEIGQVRGMLRGLLEAKEVHKSTSASLELEKFSAEIRKINDALQQSNTRLAQVEAAYNSHQLFRTELEMQQKLIQEYKSNQEDLHEVIKGMKLKVSERESTEHNPWTSPPAGPPNTTSDLHPSFQSKGPKFLNSAMLTEKHIKDIVESFVISPMSNTEGSLTYPHQRSIDPPSASPTPSNRSAVQAGGGSTSVVAPSSVLHGSPAEVPHLPGLVPPSSAPPPAPVSTTTVPENEDRRPVPTASSSLPGNHNTPETAGASSQEGNKAPAVAPGMGLPFLFNYANSHTPGRNEVSYTSTTTVPARRSSEIAKPIEGERQVTSPAPPPVMCAWGTPVDEKTPPKNPIPSNPVTPLPAHASLTLDAPSAAAEKSVSLLPEPSFVAPSAGAKQPQDGKLGFLTSIVESPVVAVPMKDQVEVKKAEGVKEEVTRCQASAPPPPSSVERVAEESTSTGLETQGATASVQDTKSEEALKPVPAKSTGEDSCSNAQTKQMDPEPSGEKDFLLSRSSVSEPMVTLPPPPPLLAAAASALKAHEAESSSSSYYYTYSEYSESEDESPAVKRGIQLSSSTTAQQQQQQQHTTPEKRVNGEREPSILVESLTSSDVPIRKINLTSLTEKKKQSIGIFKKIFH